MKKFAFISDVIFTFFVGDVITLVLFRYLGVNLPLSLLLAALCGGLTALAVGSFLQFRRKNLFLKKSDETIKRKFLLHLALLSDEGRTDYFQSLLTTSDEEVKRFGKLRLFNQTTFYFLKFTLSPLTADEIPALARLKTGKRKILLCNEIEGSAKELCERLGIEIRTGEWVYTHAKSENALPAKFLGDEEAPRRKLRFRLWFSRKNAKRFLVGGTLVLLFSRITPFYLYYLLLGSCLIIAAVFVRVFGYQE